MHSLPTNLVSTRVLGLAVVVGSSLPAPTALAFQTFANQVSFQAAIGASTNIDFENFPLNGGRFGSFANNHVIGQATFKSQTVLNNIDLFDANGNDTNLNGTFLVIRGSEGGPNNVFVTPAGYGPFGVPGIETDDDFSIQFATSVKAAGILILDNVAEANEFVQFRAANNSVIASIALPENDGFIGLLTQSSDQPIGSILVFEGAGSDDIAFDNVIFSIPEPNAVLLLAIAIAPITASGRRRP